MIRDGFPKEKEKETKAREISQRKREREERRENFWDFYTYFVV